MARIKQVLNERRIAYERAVALRGEELATEGEDAVEVTDDQSTPPKRVTGRRSAQNIASFRANNPTEPKRVAEAGEAVEEGAAAGTAKVDASV